MWGKKEINLKIKMKIFNAIVLPALLYSAIALALTKTGERKLEAFEMDMLRINVGVRWHDFVRNADKSETKIHVHLVPNKKIYVKGWKQTLDSSYREYCIDY